MVHFISDQPQFNIFEKNPSDIRFHHIIHIVQGTTRDYDKLVLNYENKILSYNLMDDSVSEINVPLTSNSTWSYNVYPSNRMFYRCLDS